jgi:hypothetical protein
MLTEMLVGKLLGKLPLGRHRRKEADKIVMDLREISFGDGRGMKLRLVSNAGDVEPES